MGAHPPALHPAHIHTCWLNTHTMMTSSSRLVPCANTRHPAPARAAASAKAIAKARVTPIAAAAAANNNNQEHHEATVTPVPSPQVNASKRQLLAFGCSCCLSLYAQQLQRPLPAHADGGQPFSYTGTEGPEHWPGACASGMQQSPVDISASLQQAAACDSRAPPVIRYQPSSSATVKNTGTTLQVNVDSGSSSISWAGQQLQLLQYHFHTPSEHTLAGAHAAMEAHLVHRNTDTGAFTVLAVLMEAAPPASQQQPDPNPCLAAGLAAVPSTHGDSAPCNGPVNPADLLPTGPALQQYVSYMGSLTTPPCSEGVEWLVWTTPMLVPQQQVQQFREFAGMNARPPQPLNTRALVSSCLGLA